MKIEKTFLVNQKLIHSVHSQKSQKQQGVPINELGS